jgi:hypothetical protein
MWKKLRSENLNTTIPYKDYGNQKQPENVKYFLITGDAKYGREIKPRIATEKVAFARKGMFLSENYTLI